MSFGPRALRLAAGGVDVDLVHWRNLPPSSLRPANHLSPQEALHLFQQFFRSDCHQARRFAISEQLLDGPAHRTTDGELTERFQRLIADERLLALQSPAPGAEPESSAVGTSGVAGMIELVTPGPDFAISAQAVMPTIKVRLTGPGLRGRTSSAGGSATRAPTVVCNWTITLALNCKEVPNGPQRVVAHPEIAARTTTPELTIPFTRVRGGTLSIKVAAQVGKHNLTAELQAVNGKPLRVVGTNPSKAQLHDAIPSKALRLIVQTESHCRQFEKGMPLFSQDNLGGVGLLQITRPPPTDEEIWDWRANVRAAIALFDQKLAGARAFPHQVRASPKFQGLVEEYQAARNRSARIALKVRLPDFTEDQVELDAIRGYNGYAGTDHFLGDKHLHEYRVRLDPNRQLVAREEADGRTATVEWERTPIDIRPAGRGPYVNHVLSHKDF